MAILANGSEASMPLTEKGSLLVMGSQSSTEVVLIGPDPERDVIRAQQEQMIEKSAGRRPSPQADGTTTSGSSSTAIPRPLPEDDGEREVLRAQVNMLQQKMEEMRERQGIAPDVEELLPPAYEGSTLGRS
jgi:hypothetical protein